MKTIYESNKKSLVIKKDDKILLSISWKMTTRIYHTFCNYTEETDCYLDLNSVSVHGNSKQTVINRSWEYYEGQSTISGSLRDCKNIYISKLEAEFKNENDYTKMTEKRNEEFKNIIEKNEDIKLINIALEEVERNSKSFIEINL